MMPVLRSLDKSELTRAEARGIHELIRLTWPPAADAGSVEDDVERFLAFPRTRFERAILVEEQGRLIGHTRLFARDVRVGDRLVANMALACVCVRPEAQGRGIGRQMVRQAFSFVDDGAFACSYFQTRVPGFYEKLGAVLLDRSRFLDSKNEGRNPWWDPHAMIYPAAADQPGRIDLVGPGY